MMRVIFAHILAVAVMVTSLSLAHARGSSPDLGLRMDMVVCTGVAVKITTIGPDGTPVQSVHLCPDGDQIFAGEFFIASVQYDPVGGVTTLVAQPVLLQDGYVEISALARGPPLVS
jgi:hypothetical protein